MMKMRRAAAALALLVLVACGAGKAGPPARPSPVPSPARSPTPAPLGPLRFQVQTVVGGLTVPWELAFLPDGTMLVTERTGQVRVIRNGRLLPQPALTLNVVQAPGVESGLLGLAVHPGFPNPPYVYLYDTHRGSSGTANRVSRFTYTGGRLVDEHVVLDGIPGGRCCHFGGRIAFGPDDLLYVAVGDAQVPGRAADRASLNGKILRIRDDGSVPPGNPFPGSPVYAWGLRNPEGLAWDDQGRLYASVNGPTGEFGLFHHDEIDLIRPGAFYGWPVWAGLAPAGPAQDYGNPPQRVPPVAESDDTTWAPSGLTFYRPDPGQRPTLLVAALTGQELLRFVIDPDRPDHVLAQQTVLSGYGRLRDVVAGPDHCLYVLTSNRDGRGNPAPDDDRILRACPQA
jgi:glucose/arabinose dehydrogenase